MDQSVSRTAATAQSPTVQDTEAYSRQDLDQDPLNRGCHATRPAAPEARQAAHKQLGQRGSRHAMEEPALWLEEERRGGQGY
ncbi:hypothetical protein H257_16089 [Aphanomyces astaci]|uniref:Uncharacterized protein n=1 Tax=Aphanomyces astaci TaxID=112090 RepID=W4FJN9_APHAT|nr:hypothetical protein H257_16089 [Aphanomyces astaci]ETV67727.1 hypothetical protein H257_16089 [Aphanomyces astaci]|eukprot:XP_009842720.1 hypothetical protein H257_16089 [Aphanomyces astaci]